MCSCRPGVKGLSKSLRVVSIVGRFLEHHRVYCFHNRGDPLYYIGSSDWMSRNLSKRVEVAAPILDPELKRQLQQVLALCLFDGVNAWDMMPSGRYVYPAFRMEESTKAAPFLANEDVTYLRKMAEAKGAHASILGLVKADVERAFLETKKES